MELPTLWCRFVEVFCIENLGAELYTLHAWNQFEIQLGIFLRHAWLMLAGEDARFVGRLERTYGSVASFMEWTAASWLD